MLGCWHGDQECSFAQYLRRIVLDLQPAELKIISMLRKLDVGLMLIRGEIGQLLEFN